MAGAGDRGMCADADSLICAGSILDLGLRNRGERGQEGPCPEQSLDFSKKSTGKGVGLSCDFPLCCPQDFQEWKRL